MRGVLDDIADESKVADILRGSFATTDVGNYLNYANGQISYIPANISIYDNQFTSDKRKSGKVARTARQFIREDIVAFELTDSDFEIFANKMKSHDISEILTLDIVSGASIKEWYDGDKVGQNTGTLSSSCMRHDECQTYFGLYTANPNQIKMLTAVHNKTGLLAGRALLWYTSEGDVVMDRVYGNDAIMEYFKTYGQSQGWYTRQYNSYQQEMAFIDPAGKTVQKTWKITLDKTNFKKYPYLDTFKYLRLEGYVTNDRHNDEYNYQLSDTRGGFSRIRI